MLRTFMVVLLLLCPWASSATEGKSDEPAAWATVQRLCGSAASGAETLQTEIVQELVEDQKWVAVVQAIPSDLRKSFRDAIARNSSGFVTLARAAARFGADGTASSVSEDYSDSMLLSALQLWGGAKQGTYLKSAMNLLSEFSQEHLVLDYLHLSPANPSDAQLRLWFTQLHPDPDFNVKLSKEERIRANMSFVYATVKIAGFSALSLPENVAYLSKTRGFPWWPFLFGTVVTGGTLLMFPEFAEGVLSKIAGLSTAFLGLLTTLLNFSHSEDRTSLSLATGWNPKEPYLKLQDVSVPTLAELFDASGEGVLDEKLSALNDVEISQLGEFELQESTLMSDFSGRHWTVWPSLRGMMMRTGADRESRDEYISPWIERAENYVRQMRIILESGSQTAGKTLLRQRIVKFEELIFELKREIGELVPG